MKEVLSIDFLSHFITSILNVYLDTTTRDRLIFPLAIMRILRHFSISIPDSPYYTTMGPISAGSVLWSKAQLRPKQPRIETDDPTTNVAPSSSTHPTFSPFSSTTGVTLKVVMA